MHILKHKYFSRNSAPLTTKFLIMSSMTGLLLFSLLTNAVYADKKSPYLRPDNIPTPIDNKLTKTRISLGKKLFFDPRLSGSNWISCGTCHNPALGWSDGLKTAIGNGQQVLGRATPTIINTAYNKHQFWDGRAKSLEEQALGPIEAAGEMNQNLDELVDELKSIPGYVELFNEAYSKDGITKKTIAKAIASFERTILSSEAPFDRYVKGDKTALNDSQKRGFELFQTKAQCVTCHSGFNFSDDQFHNIGLGQSKDAGRFAINKDNSMKGAMKTPTLRSISLTSPYMHNGKYKTLEEVVDHYNRGGDNTENKSSLISKLDLNDVEKKDLVAFMESLTGKAIPVKIPRLPH